jgi:hypothetical protein
LICHPQPLDSLHIQISTGILHLLLINRHSNIVGVDWIVRNWSDVQNSD